MMHGQTQIKFTMNALMALIISLRVFLNLNFSVFFEVPLYNKLRKCCQQYDNFSEKNYTFVWLIW